ncbi:MAG: phosphohydrolase [Planctomycetota bacterium]|jgi:hypothetical protein
MSKKNDEGWIQLFNGGFFYFDDPTPEMINILDIANALANCCRYTGHVAQFYSVAEHSVLISQCCLQTTDLKMWALLHDATEAYIGDMNWPLKQKPYMRDYCTLEKKIMNVIAEKFQLSEGFCPDIIKELDRCICQDEREALLPPSDKSWGINPDDKINVKIECWQPHYARSRFLNRFKELGGEI